MNILRLVKDGIFPVVRDREGHLLLSAVATELNIAGTVQGEGKLMGVPSLFVRLSGCNLRCAWQFSNGSVTLCDTPCASYYASEYEEWQVSDILKVIAHNLGNTRHVVITGGEPLLQKEALTILVKELKQQLHLHITIESNGTLFDHELAQWIDLFSLSPKLKNSIPDDDKLQQLGITIGRSHIAHHKNIRYNISVLQQYIDICQQYNNKDFQLKFVISMRDESEEIKEDFLYKLKGVSPQDVLLMPAGATIEEQRKSIKEVLFASIKNGWRFAPRLQLELFGNKSGT